MKTLYIIYICFPFSDLSFSFLARNISISCSREDKQVLLSDLCACCGCHRFRSAVFSGYMALLPLTGMWYRISFQNLNEGDSFADNCVSFPPVFSASVGLSHVGHCCFCLWFFHKHTAPCFLLRWRTDSGKRANWSGLISSSSTRITCKGELHLASASVAQEGVFNHLRYFQSCRRHQIILHASANTKLSRGSRFSHLERSFQQCSVHPSNNLKLLPVVRIHATVVIDEAVPRLAVRADDVVLGEDDVVVVAGVSEGGRVVEKKESAARLQALFYRVHHSCEKGRSLTWALVCDELGSVNRLIAH